MAIMLANDFPFLSGNGEMAAGLRSSDWQSTALGSPSSWPENLQALIGVCLDADFPVAVWWGPSLIQLYNDRFCSLLGAARHPAAFGRPAQESWPDLWPTIGPAVEQVMMRSVSTHLNDVPLSVEREGCVECCYITFSFTPIRSPSGNTAGIFATAAETTAAVLASRREAFQQTLTDCLRESRRPDDGIAAATGLLGQYLGASHVHYAEVDRAAGTFCVAAKWIAASEVPDLPGTGLIADFRHALPVIHAGEPFVVEDLHATERVGAAASLYAAAEIRSIMMLPLFISGSVQGVLHVADVAARRWSQEDIAAATLVADGIRQAVEKVQAEETLRQCEQRAVQAASQAEHERRLFDALLAATPVGIVMADVNGRILRVNPANKQIWGENIPFSESIEAYESWKGWWADGSERHGRRLKPYDWPMSRALLGEEAPHEIVEIEPFGLPGVRRTISCSAAPIRDGERNVIGAVVAQINITDRTEAEAARRASEAHLSAIFEQTAAGIAESDLSGRFKTVNDRYCRIVGRSRAELIGYPIRSIILPEDLEENVRLLDSLVKTGEPFMIENRYLLPDGSPVWVSKTMSAIRAADGKSVETILAVVLDITERKRAEEALREQTDRLQIATDAAELGLFDHDLLTSEVNWNARTREQFGVSPDEKITRALLFERIHPDDRERVRHRHNQLIGEASDRRYSIEYRILTPEGGLRWIAAKGKLFCDASGKSARLVGTIMDITERMRIEKQMQQASQHDSLTGLPNRALLYEYCSHILAMSSRYGEPGAVLFIDLDRFKPINDMYGHDVGDKVLQEVARRLLACSRKEDIISRLGGDEFIVVLPRTGTTSDAAKVARHMLHAIGQPMRIGALQLNVSPSIGISLFPEHAGDLELLIRCADLAMYAAKRDGRNNVKVYSTGLNAQADGLLRLEILLKHAIETDRLILFYQPILDVESLELIGAEGLIRIPGEDGTPLGPTEFMPVAETAGLMNRIGNWVVREACRQHRIWRDTGLPPITIAVNVSPTQFRQHDFVSFLEEAVREFDIDPACLQIEVTESTIMDNVPDTVKTLHQLQSMGIKIALDDFGTGYSSLSQLSNLPLNKLKIDQSFIKKMASSERSRSITEAIIGLGQTLNLKVVGEGVESEASMDLLRGYGCNQAQGYLFSEPLPAREFELWYRKHLARTTVMRSRRDQF